MRNLFKSKSNLKQMKAAALNLQGSLKARQKKIGEAQRSFEDAIRLDTAFTIAKQNLEALGK